MTAEPMLLGLERAGSWRRLVGLQCMPALPQGVVALAVEVRGLTVQCGSDLVLQCEQAESGHNRTFLVSLVFLVAPH
jgi:hypothetical protein